MSKFNKLECSKIAEYYIQEAQPMLTNPKDALRC